MKTSRATARATWEIPVRVGLLETDADEHDSAIAELSDRMGKMLWVMVGILVSTTTAAVLLAMDLAVGK